MTNVHIQPPICTDRALELSWKDSNIRYLDHLGNSDIAKLGLSGFPNAKTLNMTSSYADDGLMGQPRLEENGPLDSWSEAEVWCPIRPAFELESTRG